MKKYLLTGTLMFLVGLAIGRGISRESRVENPTHAVASGIKETQPPKYEILGVPDEEDFFPEEAFNSFIVGEDGSPRSFEEFKEMLAQSKMVNPLAPSFRREAILVYGGALVKAFGLKAIDEIVQSPVLADFGPAAPGMFEMMYTYFGQDAAIRLIESYSNKQIKTLLYGQLASRIAGENYLEAINIAQLHAPLKLKDFSFVAYLMESASRSLDEEGLIELVTSFDSAQTRLFAAEATGAKLFSGEIELDEMTLSRLVEFSDPVLRKALVGSFLSEALSVNPELILNPLLTGINLEYGHFNRAGSFMYGRGWDEAFDLGLKIPGEEGRTAYLLGLVDATVIAGDNATAIEYSINAYNEGLDDGQMLSRAVGAVARFSPKEAVEFMTDPNLPPEVKETLMIATIQDIAAGDIEQAKKIIKTSHLTEMTRDRLYTDMARPLAEEDPESAFIETLSHIKDPIYRKIASRDVAQEYFRQDSEAALMWLERIPAGSIRDDLFYNVANEMIKTDVLGAIELVTKIDDPDSRLNSVATLYSNAKYIQPALAEVWAKENPEWLAMLKQFENSSPSEAMLVR